MVAALGDLRTNSRPTHSLGIGHPCIGIAGIPLSALRSWTPSRVNERAATAAIILIGDIGGNAEETAAALIKSNVKNRDRFIRGRQPSGTAHGPAGAIIRGGQGPRKISTRLWRSGIRLRRTSADLGSRSLRSEGSNAGSYVTHSSSNSI